MEPVNPQWFEMGVFNWFNFSPEVIQKFTINPNLSALSQKEEKKKLGEEMIFGSCKFCKYTSRVQYKNPSNWVRHLLQHPEEHRKYKIFISERKHRKEFQSDSPTLIQTQIKFDIDPLAPVAKKPRLENTIGAVPNPIPPKLELPKDLQDKINFRAFELVIGEILPIDIVESVHFRNYSKSIDSKVNPICVKSLKLFIAKEFVKFKSHIKLEFQLANHVCLTIDIWGARNRCFIGVTAHWIKLLPDGTILRISAAIACKRFPGTHTHVKTAEILQKVMEEYGLPSSKVTHIITENGSRFVDAFKQLSKGVNRTVEDAQSSHGSQSEDPEDALLAEALAVLDELDKDEEPDDAIIIKEASNLNTSAYDLLQQHSYDIRSSIVLPDHLRCASHTLEMIAKTETDPKDGLLQKSWMKLTTFWNRIDQFYPTNESNSVLFGVALQTPCADRWISFYESTIAFLNHLKDLAILNNLVGSIGLDYQFTTEDVSILKEYSELLKPLANALYIFQGKANCFSGIGMVLPLLTRVRKTLRDKFFPNLGPMREKVIESIDEKFGNVFDDESYLIAAITHPFFKTKWMNQEAAKSAKTMLKQLIISDSNSIEERNHQDPAVDDFLKDEDNLSEKEEELDQVDFFLRDKDNSIKMLDKYPQIKSLFIKHNTSIPTNAPIEDLFSVDSIILTVLRKRLSDNLLEMFILLKIFLKLDSNVMQSN